MSCCKEICLILFNPVLSKLDRRTLIFSSIPKNFLKKQKKKPKSTVRDFRILPKRCPENLIFLLISRYYIPFYLPINPMKKYYCGVACSLWTHVGCLLITTLTGMRSPVWMESTLFPCSRGMRVFRQTSWRVAGSFFLPENHCGPSLYFLVFEIGP